MASSSPNASNSYSSSGCSAMAKFDGRVHGVVVQMTTEIFRPSAASFNHCGAATKSNFTYTLGALYGAYSTSASASAVRSEEHTSELQSRGHLVCRLLLEKKKYNIIHLA